MFNPWSLSRPEYPEDTRTFEDRGGKLTLTFRRPSVVDLSAAAGRTREYIEAWVDSGQAFPTPDGGPPIPLNEELLKSIAVLQTLQQGPEPELLGLSEWVGVAVTMPMAWAQINVWARELITAAETDLGNSPRATADA